MTGTGFLLGHNNKLFIVTAKHVAVNITNSGRVILNDARGKAINVSFKNLRKGGVRWFLHPSADIAIHPVQIQQELNHTFYPSDAIPKNDLKIPLLSSVYVLGFPLGLGVNESLNPIAKKAQVASETILMKSLGKIILFDEAIAQGYSGSPIFYIVDVMTSNTTPSFKVDEKAILIGVLSFQVGDKMGGKISGIVPTGYIWEILNSPDFQKYETQNN